MLSNNIKKYNMSGYYKYKNIVTASKYEIMMIAENVKDVQWWYHDEFFNSFDWTKEPIQDLSTLYCNRAKKLREQYDYIVLMYSGGSDSNNILDTFAKNNIHLDEICSHINYKGSGIIENLLNNEILNKHGAKEKAENYIKQYNMNTKFRLYDVTERTLETYSNYNFNSSYYINNAGVSYTHTKPKAGTIMETGVKEWMDMYAAGKKICFLWGNHKPHITGVNASFYFVIDDYIDQSISVKGVLDKQTDAVDELFYWGPNEESVNIMIKQGHILKKYLSDFRNQFFLMSKYNKFFNEETFLNPEEIYQNEIFSTYTYKFNHTIPKNHICRLGNTEIRRLIYPNWKPEDEILNKKQISNFLNNKDKWFWNSNIESKSIYLNGLQHFTNTIQPCWIDGEDGKMQFENKQYVKKTIRISKLYRIQ